MLLRLCVVAVLMIPSPSYGGSLLEPCLPCHKKSGEPVKTDVTPLIGSQNTFYLTEVLKDYATGKRPTEVAAHRQIPPHQQAAYAAHFAQQRWVSPWQPVEQKRAERGKSLVKGCERCHREGGRVQFDENPRLAGQRMAYLRLRLHQFRTAGKIPPQPEKMRNFIGELNDEQIEDVVHFYANNR
ncbi:cytochrome c553 [Magnetococcus marinus MC-1]|uniref:Cytochrome c553 n=1 Tax=Magnetococcus marinus (strain ATCC BAA-1437 / JCM 17883 / MC-1) TaxID=156889 RepID=A0L3L5_MAGMM|nr:c-type cytochrome [Magnetococcus marinus]ABK42558.1 cytochrome c553 [Magnetococcus marinus MC-1]